MPILDHLNQTLGIVERQFISRIWKIRLCILTFALADKVFWLSFRTNNGNWRVRTSPCSFNGELSGSTGNHILNSATQFCKVFIGMMHKTFLPSVYRRNTSQNEITCDKKYILDEQYGRWFCIRNENDLFLLRFYEVALALARLFRMFFQYR